MSLYVNHELMEQAKRWGELIRKEEQNHEDYAEMGMHGAALFMAMMQSPAPAKAFDDIIVAAAKSPIEGFTIVQLDDVPEEYKDCPLHSMFDPFSMGQRLGLNVWSTFSQHATEFLRYLTLVDTNTGKRIRIHFHKE